MVELDVTCCFHVVGASEETVDLDPGVFKPFRVIDNPGMYLVAVWEKIVELLRQVLDAEIGHSFLGAVGEMTCQQPAVGHAGNDRGSGPQIIGDVGGKSLEG